MNLWSQLISAALVGTDRRPAPSPPPDSALALPLAGQPGPERLLGLAAVVTLARRAGLPPQTGVAPPPPAPAETADVVSPAAAARLTSLLNDEPRGPGGQQQRIGLLAEWLSLAARHGQRVQPGLLPRLLDEARVRPQWRPVVATVGGRRATWLAGQNSAWAWLLDQSAVDDESQWQEGTAVQRLSYVVGLRRRDPDRARELLVEALPTEPPANRTALLSTLEYGLSAHDEALLESGLDDRRKEVRVVAAGLLAALPDSGYRRRMTARAVACLRPGPAGEIVVRPPAECDATMRRDGVEPRPPRGIGERAWWLAQIIGRTPLAAWRDLEPEPATLLGREIADGWQIVVHRAWAQATVDQHDPRWAAAFVRGDSPAMARDSPAVEVVGSVYRQLAAGDAVDVAVALLDADDAYADHVLPSCPHPWPADLITATLARLRRFATSPGYQLSTLITLASAGFPTELAPAARELAETHRAEHGDDRHAPFFDRLADTLTLRHQMHQEFQ